MARQSKEERLAELHAEALEEFDDIQSACGEERLQCLSDRRFYSISGAQWEGPLGDQFANKPRFEFNKVHLAVIRIFNEYRNNRITVDFQPLDGETNDDLADTCDGLYRADEQSCTADEAYDNAYEEGVGGGMGAFRLRTKYEDEEDDDDERQRVTMEPIFDADSCVFFNLGAKRQDKSDAKRCFVLTPYPTKAYIKEFGDDPTTWPKPVSQTEFDWVTSDQVWVAELYDVEEVRETVRVYRGLDPEADDMHVTDADIEADPQLIAELTATGFKLAKEKKVTRKKVHKYLMSGNEIIEDCGYISGSCIPIIPFYAKRWVTDGVERMMGHVRLAKDAQRLSNMLMSWLASMAARFDIEKPIFTKEQIAGLASEWANDNVDQYAFLRVNAITDASGQQVAAGPVGYTRAPNIPPAMAALTQIAEQALSDLLGNQQAGEQIQPNLSGKAVELIQQRLDMQVFIYMSNFAKTMKRAGEVWLSMMRDIAIEDGRKMKTLGTDGQPGSVVINQPAYDEEKGTDYIKNELRKCKMEVAVDVGPSSSSKRAGVVRAMTGMLTLTQDPETAQVLTSMAMMNMEGEGISEVREFFRAKLVRMGAVKPNEEEKAQLQAEQQNRQPDPQAQYLAAAAEQATADAAKKRADTVESIASAELKRAQTEETLAKTAGERQGHVLNVAEALRAAAMPPKGMSPM